MYYANETIGYFISFGEGVKLYTLRAQTKGVNVMGGVSYSEVRDYHVVNLSSNREAAVQKAAAYAARDNVRFLSCDSVKQDLFEIRRRSKEEMAEAERIAEEERVRHEERVIEIQLEKYEQAMKDLQAFGENLFSFGKYEGRTFYDVVTFDPGYINYLITANKDVPYDIPKSMFEITMNKLFHMVLHGDMDLTQKESTHFASLKDKVEVEVTVRTKVIKDTQFGISIFYVFVTDEGNVLTTTYSGNTWSLKDGEKATIKGTVKQNDFYQGTAQTVLTRVKVLKQQFSDEEE